MKHILLRVILISMIFLGCKNDLYKNKFSFFSEQFSDTRILRYKIPGFQKLNLNQKKLVYYLTQAGLSGRDIIYDQNYKHNLSIRRALENIYQNFNGDRSSNSWKEFEIYLKRIWFSNGIHHHYSNDKFIPKFSKKYLKDLLDESKTSLNYDAFDAIFNSKDLKKVNLDPKIGLIKGSAINFYDDNITESEVNDFYKKIKLDDSISVTIIATGFDVDQQNDIVNTEPKKIIHTLEDEQKMEHLLISQNDDKNNLGPFNLVQEESNHNQTDKSNYNILLTEEVLEIDVEYEEILFKKTKHHNSEEIESKEFKKKSDDLNQDFIINDLSEDVDQLEIIEEEVIESKQKIQTTFDFDTSFNKVNESISDEIKFDLEKDVLESDYMKEDSIKKYSDIHIDNGNDQESYDQDTDITIIKSGGDKTDIDIKNIEVNDPEFLYSNNENGNPFEKSIDQTNIDENKNRMIHLKEFNYSFKTSSNKIDELEKQPAYKRSGLDLEEGFINKNNTSDVIIQTDDEENLNLKSNNSFLHDNAD